LGRGWGFTVSMPLHSRLEHPHETSYSLLANPLQTRAPIARICRI
jgi:hypothetical protein